MLRGPRQALFVSFCFFQVFGACCENLVWRSGYLFFQLPVFAQQKKSKNFLSVLCCARPPSPQNSKLRGAAAHGFTRIAFFFLQVVAFMSAAASTLNLGGKGGEQQNEQNGFASIFANTGIRQKSVADEIVTAKPV